MTKQILRAAHIPELSPCYTGKVRDNYDLPDGRRIIIASDRLSAFDRPICAIPEKGRILTETAEYWFTTTQNICPNHVLGYPDPNVILAKKLRMLPVEIVVRDYLAGTTSTSLLNKYKLGQRHMYGVTLPDGMRDNELLPRTLITPTTKSDEHDAPVSPQEVIERSLMTEAQWEQIEAYALALFRDARERVRASGLILVDTKYEFGLDENNEIVLADEIHTPDSSRFWFTTGYPSAYTYGEAPMSFDKDFVRRWVSERCDPYRGEIPVIPDHMIEDTTDVYIRAFEKITGVRFERTDLGEHPSIIDRIRDNLWKNNLL